MKEQAFVKEFRDDQFYLRDHIVNREKILPEAAYIEIARAAGELAGQQKVAGLKNIVWLSPLKIDDKSEKLKLSVYPKNGKFFWMAADANSEKTVYAQGEILYDSNDSEEIHFMDVESVKNRLSLRKTKDECYQMFETGGINYGKSFQVIESLNFDENEVLAKLKTPDFLLSDFDDFAIHPVLLDGAFQTIAGLTMTEEEAFLPFSMEEIQIIRPMEPEIYACAALSDSKTKSFDIKLVNADGEILAIISKFRAMAIKKSDAEEKTFERSSAKNQSVEYCVSAKQPTAQGLEKQLIEDLLSIASTTLQVEKDQLDPEDDISDYGFDSLTLSLLTKGLNEKFSLGLTPPEMFAHPSIESLKDYLLEYHKNAIVNYYHSSLETSEKEEEIESDELPAELPSFKARFADVRPSTFGTRSAGYDEIAVVGMAARFPEAANLREFWRNLIEGKDCVGEIPEDRWDWRLYENEEEFCSKWGGFITDIDKFDAEFFKISPREAELMDPQQRVFLEVVWETLEDAGIRPSELKGSETGIFVGTSGSTYYKLLQKGNADSDPHALTGIAPSVLVNRISYLLGWHGPSEAVDTACSSSLVALDRALQTLRNGDCEMAVVGGVNLILTPDFHLSFSKAGMLSREGRCKTFDSRANGYVRAEGAGAILLKPLDGALKDGDRIYGLIKSSAVNHGGRVTSLTAPNPVAQANLVIKAHKKAGFSPDSVGYIECHGTGTPLGDPIEINGLKKAFSKLFNEWGLEKPNDPRCGLGAVKTNIGHLEAASGIAGVIKTLLTFQYKKLPGNLHLQKVNPYIELENTPFYMVSENRDWERFKDESGADLPLRAGVSSFGFGGANAHVILEEFPDEVFSPAEIEGPFLAILSAKNEGRLKACAENLIRFSEESGENVSLSDIAYTLQVGREAMEERLALVARSKDELTLKLKEYLRTGREAPDLYLGNAQNSSSIDQNPEESISPIIKERKFDKLARLWVDGAKVDWSLLYVTAVPRRISLPAYPFAKERYWVEECEDAEKRRAGLLTAAKKGVHSSDNHAALDSISSQASVVFSADSLEETQNRVSEIMVGILKLRSGKIDVNKSFDNYGMDSIMMIGAVSTLKTEWGIEIPMGDIAKLRDVASISRYLLENNLKGSIDRGAGINKTKVEIDALSEDETNEALESKMSPHSFTQDYPDPRLEFAAAATGDKA